jgi:hypothetical protein
MTGIRKSDNASPSRGRSRTWEQCTRYVLCSQYVLLPDRSRPLWSQAKRGRPNYLRIGQKTPRKNKRLAKRRGASHGRFPKEKRHVYTEFMLPDPAPIANYFVACADHQRLTTTTSRCSPFPTAAGVHRSLTGQGDDVDVRTLSRTPPSHSPSTHFEITRPRLHAPFRPQDCFHCCLAEHRRKSVHRSALFCVARYGREFSRRAQKISPAQAGPSQREETPPVQGHSKDIRVGCACYGQLKLASPCDFWDTVLKRGERSIAVMVF